MKKQQAFDKLSSIHQSHLLKYWDGLSEDQQKHLLEQIHKIDLSVLQQQRQLIAIPQDMLREIEPFNDFARSGNIADEKNGREMIAEGLMGCLIVAGGQGTRLRFNGPKGMFPVTPVRKKTLFELFAEKILAAGKQAGRPLSVAIMTSPLNHEETVNFFNVNSLFGLKQEQVFFFSQEMLPFLDHQGHLFLESKSSIAEGPDGNGGALHRFYHSGIWQSWYEKGIRYLNFILIDNPLADPFDAELLGFQNRLQSDVVIKCMTRDDPNESLGMLAKEDKRVVVVEYSEMNERDRRAIRNDGSLLYDCANLSLFCFHMDFIKNAVWKDKSPMPLHKAFKAANYLDEHGRTVQAEKPIAWKFEKYIFDLLMRANKVDALLFPREICFSPLKNFSGNCSLQTVQADLQRRDQQVLSQVTGKKCNLSPLEISQDFYYPTPNLLAKWHGKHIVQGGYVGE